MTTTVPLPQPVREVPVPPPQQRGRGTRLVSNVLGSALSATGGGGNFDHPFRPSLGSNAVRIGRGLIETTDGWKEPLIGKVPISGDAEHAQPVLLLDPALANSDGESWIALEVEPNAQGLLTKDTRREVVHTKLGISLDPKLGRQHLVMILWRQKRAVRAIPIVRYNLGYLRFLPAPGLGAVRHLFP